MQSLILQGSRIMHGQATVLLGTAYQALIDALKCVKDSEFEKGDTVSENLLRDLEVLIASIRLYSVSNRQKLMPPTHARYGHLVKTPQSTNGIEKVTESNPSIWSGFYNKTLRERLDVLSLMYPSAMKPLRHSSDVDRSVSPQRTGRRDRLSGTASEELGVLPSRTANIMIENCIGVLGIPLGCVGHSI